LLKLKTLSISLFVLPYTHIRTDATPPHSDIFTQKVCISWGYWQIFLLSSLNKLVLETRGTQRVLRSLASAEKHSEMSCSFSADTLETPSRVHQRSSSRLSSPGSAPPKRDSRGLRSSLSKVLVTASISSCGCSQSHPCVISCCVFPTCCFGRRKLDFCRLMGVSETFAISGRCLCDYGFFIDNKL